jgi:hypothetical protein
LLHSYVWNVTQQEQPLLLEDLLEQEKRELQRQQQMQQLPNVTGPEKSFLSDTEFEKVKADVLAGGASSMCLSPPALGPQQPPAPGPVQGPVMMGQPGFTGPSPNQVAPMVGHPSQQNVVVVGQRIGSFNNPNQLQQHPHHLQQQQQQQQQQHMYPQQQQQPFMRPPMQQQPQQQQWQMQQQQPQQTMTVRPPVPSDPGMHPALMQAQTAARPPLPPQLLPAHQPPPENPTTEAERQQQISYEQWLMQQQHLIRVQQQYFETEVNKFRKQRKSLNSRQRQLRKNGQELNESDASDLERITGEQQSLQKQLDQVRRQARQHTMLVQDYRNKQQKRQQQMGGQMGPGEYHSYIHSVLH